MDRSSLNQPMEVSRDNHWNWTDSSSLRDIPFTGTPGPSDAARRCVTPAEFLGLFLSVSVVESLVTETNRYAAESRHKTPSSMSWVPVTEKEMSAFLGLQIAMGVANVKFTSASVTVLQFGIRKPLYKLTFHYEKTCIL